MDDIEAELNIAERENNDPSSEDERCRSSIQAASLLHVVRATDSGFHRCTKLCLKAIRDDLLHHRWQEAAQYLACYFQTLEDTNVTQQLLACEIIWRLGTEVLKHHPNSRLEDFNALYERMKNTGVLNYAKICLEHSFHLLVNGQLQEAKRQLSISMSWRYGKQQENQAQELRLIRAYCGFLHYLIWCSKRSSESEVGNDTDRHEMHSCFRQASVTLQEIITQPGVWDTFILSYVDMLEFYDDLDGALKVLQDYAYNKDYPTNPNAHVYLYQFLKKHNASPAKCRSVLKELHCIVPSHELMLEYCALLLKTELQEDLQEALCVVMNLLDYTSWKMDLNAWDCLLTVLNLLIERNLRHIIDKEWDQRRDLWRALHFRKYHCRMDFDEDVKLPEVKSKVIRLLAGHNVYYTFIFSEVCGNKERKDERVAKKNKKR